MRETLELREDCESAEIDSLSAVEAERTFFHGHDVPYGEPESRSALLRVKKHTQEDMNGPTSVAEARTSW